MIFAPLPRHKTVTRRSPPASIRRDPITRSEQDLVANDGSNDVPVIDGATHATSTFPVGSRPRGSRSIPKPQDLLSNAATRACRSSTRDPPFQRLSTSPTWAGRRSTGDEQGVCDPLWLRDEVSIIDDETYPNTAATRSYSHRDRLNPVTNVLYIRTSPPRTWSRRRPRSRSLSHAFCRNGSGGFKQSGPSDPDPDPASMSRQAVAVTVNPSRTRSMRELQPHRRSRSSMGLASRIAYVCVAHAARRSGGKAIAVNPAPTDLRGIREHVVVVNGADNGMTLIPRTAPCDRHQRIHQQDLRSQCKRHAARHRRGHQRVFDAQHSRRRQGHAVNPVTTHVRVGPQRRDPDRWFPPAIWFTRFPHHGHPPLPGTRRARRRPFPERKQHVLSRGPRDDSQGVLQLDSIEGAWKTAAGSVLHGGFTGLARGVTQSALAANGLSPVDHDGHAENPIVGISRPTLHRDGTGYAGDPSVSLASSVQSCQCRPGRHFHSDGFGRRRHGHRYREFRDAPPPRKLPADGSFERCSVVHHDADFPWAAISEREVLRNANTTRPPRHHHPGRDPGERERRPHFVGESVHSAERHVHRRVAGTRVSPRSSGLSRRRDSIAVAARPLSGGSATSHGRPRGGWSFHHGAIFRKRKLRRATSSAWARRSIPRSGCIDRPRIFREPLQYGTKRYVHSVHLRIGGLAFRHRGVSRGFVVDFGLRGRGDFGRSRHMLDQRPLCREPHDDRVLLG